MAFIFQDLIKCFILAIWCFCLGLYHKIYDVILFNLHWERNICGGFHNSWKRSPSWLAAFPISRSRLTLRFVSGLSRKDLQKNVFFSFQQKFGPQLHKWVFCKVERFVLTHHCWALLNPVSLDLIEYLSGKYKAKVWVAISCDDCWVLVLASRHQLVIAE